MRLLLPHFGQLPFHSGDRHMKNIVLIGMMGCGKSTCGRLLAERLDRELVDTDAFIEARQAAPSPTSLPRRGRRTSARWSGRRPKIWPSGRDWSLPAAAVCPFRKPLWNPWPARAW